MKFIKAPNKKTISPLWILNSSVNNISYDKKQLNKQQLKAVITAWQFYPRLTKGQFYCSQHAVSSMHTLNSTEI